MNISRINGAVCLIMLCTSLTTFAQGGLTEDMLSAFEFRNIGAFRVGAWISSIAVPEQPGDAFKHTFFVAARNGGVWKTDNNGTTFRPVFDAYGVNSVSCIQIARVSPLIVWVGTGESYNCRNSLAGNGIYKSTDGGETFTPKGLYDSHHISKIVIHPNNPDIVYAAVMGHLFSYNEDRGVFKTEDGGNTWKKILYVSDRTGVIDLIMNPAAPDTLFASAYEKYRYPWHFEAGGHGSAVYRSTNGGRTWEKCTEGLPAGTVGRIGLGLCRSRPETVYALFENLNPKDPTGTIKTKGLTSTSRDSYYDQLIGGEMYRSDNAGGAWHKVNEPRFNLSSKAAYSFNIVSVDPNDENRIYVLSAGLHSSRDGGKTWSGFDEKEKDKLFPTVFGDYRAMWIDPNDSRHIILGSDGGAYMSYDGGKTAEHLNNIPIGEVYTVAADMQAPYNIYCGLQDHEAWRGPSNSWTGSITLEDWALVGISDGMYCVPDNDTMRWLYTTGQFGQHQRVDVHNGQRVSIVPKRPKADAPYRFTWTTPLLVSQHNSSILFTGAEVLLRSVDRGNHWEEISPDLTTDHPGKTNGRGHIQYCTITTISESRLNPGLLWVGTDDGKVHVTQNHGRDWHDCTGALTQGGAPSHFWVTRVVASNHTAGTAYVTQSGYGFDDFRPVAFRTTDFGRTWRDIAGNLPRESVNVLWEDSENPALLFLGTDGGAYASIDSGTKWTKFKNLPPVPVKDLIVHQRENDLVIGTWGRGCFIAHVGPLKLMRDAVLRKDAMLFPVKSKPLRNYSEQAWWGNRELMGNTYLATPNEPNGFEIYYYLKEKVSKAVHIEIHNAEDSLLTTIDGSAAGGLHRVVWNFENLTPGQFRVTLIVDHRTYEHHASILPPLVWPVGNQHLPRRAGE